MILRHTVIFSYSSALLIAFAFSAREAEAQSYPQDPALAPPTATPPSPPETSIPPASETPGAQSPSAPEVPSVPPPPPSGAATASPGSVPPYALSTSPPPTYEDDDHPVENVEGSGAFLIGTGIFDFSNLDDRLKAARYQRIKMPPLLLGGEGRVIFGSGFTVGGRGMALLFRSSSGPNDTDATLAGGFGLLEFGFAAVHTRSMVFTIAAGIGGYGTTLNLADSADADFDDVLDDPKRSASIARGGVLGGLTLGFDGHIPIGPPKRHQQGFFTIGVRVTGLFGPALGDWMLGHDATVNNGPDTGLSGGLASLAIGFGGGPAAP